MAMAHRGGRARHDGLTLAELLVVVVILGIAAVSAGTGLLSVSRRERLNALALEIAGWIEQVRNQAANQINATDSLGGCTVLFNNSISSAGAGAGLASIQSGSTCPNLSSTSLSIPNARSSTFRICSNQSSCGGGSGSASSQQTIVFTPRGMIRATPALGASSIYEYRFTLSDLRGPKRCVRISDITGSVDLGYGSDADLATACSSYGGL